MNAVMERIGKAATELAQAFNRVARKIREDAEAGKPEAQYVVYTAEIRYWKRRISETEAKLRITKKTTARRDLQRTLDYQLSMLAAYENRQKEVLELCNTNNSEKNI